MKPLHYEKPALNWFRNGKKRLDSNKDLNVISYNSIHLVMMMRIIKAIITDDGTYDKGTMMTRSDNIVIILSCLLNMDSLFYHIVFYFTRRLWK